MMTEKNKNKFDKQSGKEAGEMFANFYSSFYESVVTRGDLKMDKDHFQRIAGDAFNTYYTYILSEDGVYNV
jgi:hypothetical protein